MSSKEIAGELTNYDWELFTAVHEVKSTDMKKFTSDTMRVTLSGSETDI